MLQTGQPDASTSNGSAADTSITVSLTTVAPGAWMVSLAIGVLQLPVASTGVTSRNANANSRYGDSNASLSPGSNSMTWTNGGTDSFNVLQASFKPVPDQGGAILFFT